jgi:Uma2 family endonuclease
MSAVPKPPRTPEHYLELDRQAEFRSEYVSGEILAMAGASREHNRITLNIGAALTFQLRGQPCEPFTSDLRVKGRTTGAYLFPDVVVGCAPLEFEDSRLDILLNPVVVMEVLSPSTEANDRSWKFAHYRRLPTLQDYVLLSQNQPFVEHYTRQADSLWTLAELVGLEAVLRLPSIGCELPLSDIYKRVEFTKITRMPLVGKSFAEASAK